jgi:hypothetical protein
MLLLGEPDPSPAGAMHQLGGGQKRHRLGCTVVSTITLEKSAGLAAPVRDDVQALLDQGDDFSSPCAGASASSTNGRTQGRAERTPRRRIADNRGSRSNARTQPHRRGRACA